MEDVRRISHTHTAKADLLGYMHRGGYGLYVAIALYCTEMKEGGS